MEPEEAGGSRKPSDDPLQLLGKALVDFEYLAGGF